MNINGVNVSSLEFVKDCDKEQLEVLITLAQERLRILKDIQKQKYWVVSDGFCVHGYFRENERDKAQALAVKRIEQGDSTVEIDLQKFREDELKGWLD